MQMQRQELYAFRNPQGQKVRRTGRVPVPGPPQVAQVAACLLYVVRRLLNSKIYGCGKPIKTKTRLDGRVSLLPLI